MPLTNKAGFSIIELLIVMAIFAIVVTISYPLMKDVTQNSRTRSAARELFSRFQTAKMEAVKRNLNVGIVFTTAGTHKYETFIDADADGVLDASENILSSVTLPNGHVLQNITFSAANPAGFGPQGRPYKGLGNGTAEIKNSSTGTVFRITTSVAGYVHMAKL